MTKIVWLRSALANVIKIHQYYVDEGVPDQARRISAKIRSSVLQLKEFPALGRPGRVSGTHEIVVTKTPYLVVYRIHADQIQILRVLHSSQKWPKSTP